MMRYFSSAYQVGLHNPAFIGEINNHLKQMSLYSLWLKITTFKNSCNFLDKKLQLQAFCATTIIQNG